MLAEAGTREDRHLAEVDVPSSARLDGRLSQPTSRRQSRDRQSNVRASPKTKLGRHSLLGRTLRHSPRQDAYAATMGGQSVRARYATRKSADM